MLTKLFQHERVQPVFFMKYTFRHCTLVRVVLQHRDAGLRQDRPMVKLFIYQMHRAPRIRRRRPFSTASVHKVTVHARASVLRQGVPGWIFSIRLTETAARAGRTVPSLNTRRGTRYRCVHPSALLKPRSGKRRRTHPRDVTTMALTAGGTRLAPARRHQAGSIA